MRPDLATVRAIFDAVLASPRGDRDAELRRRCLGDDLLRRRVEGLLRHCRTDDGATVASTPCFAAPRIPPDEGPAGFARPTPIGRGGMGEVFESVRLADERPVALKFPHRSDDADTLRRFEREARILASLDHAGVVRLLGRGRHAGRPFLVLELVEGGRPIDRYVREERAGLREAIGFAIEMAAAIRHAHDRGFVHRDLKPSNVLVDRRGEVKLLDFGIAKAQRDDLEASLLHTSAEQVLGSLAAMSPEQTRLVNAPVDTRSDIYQLGLVLHRLVAGDADLGGSAADPLARLRSIARGVRVAEIPGDPALAAPLRRVLQAALRVHPDDRHQSMADLASDLEAVLAGAFTRPTAPGFARRGMRSIARRVRRQRRTG